MPIRLADDKNCNPTAKLEHFAARINGVCLGTELSGVHGGNLELLTKNHLLLEKMAEEGCGG